MDSLWLEGASLLGDADDSPWLEDCACDCEAGWLSEEGLTAEEDWIWLSEDGMMLEAGEDGVVAIAHEARAVRIVEKSNVLCGECFIVPPLYRWATRFAIASPCEKETFFYNDLDESSSYFVLSNGR